MTIELRNMKRTSHPKNVFELKLLKQKLIHKIEMREEVLDSEITKLRYSFSGLVKSTARIYSQRLAIYMLFHLIYPKQHNQ
jgi:hypothetical protein